MKALAPAKVIAVELFEDDGVALVIVPDYQLSLAIGREGQNVRLAARLTGWRLDITSETEADEARDRYLAERAERTAEEAPPAEASEDGSGGSRRRWRRYRCRAHPQARGVPPGASRHRRKDRRGLHRFASASAAADASRSRSSPGSFAGIGWLAVRRPRVHGARPGRGVYLCSAACVKKAEKNKRYPGLSSAASEYGLISSSDHDETYDDRKRRPCSLT